MADIDSQLEEILYTIQALQRDRAIYKAAVTGVVRGMKKRDDGVVVMDMTEKDRVAFTKAVDLL